MADETSASLGDIGRPSYGIDGIWSPPPAEDSSFQGTQGGEGRADRTAHNRQHESLDMIKPRASGAAPDRTRKRWPSARPPFKGQGACAGLRPAPGSSPGAGFLDRRCGAKAAEIASGAQGDCRLSDRKQRVGLTCRRTLMGITSFSCDVAAIHSRVNARFPDHRPETDLARDRLS